MTDLNLELQELARALVACERWRWMPGMLSRFGNNHKGGGYRHPDRPLTEIQCSEWWPDLTDAATVGCLLALLLDAVGPGYHNYRGKLVFNKRIEWLSMTVPDAAGDTAGETVAKALLAAWGVVE